MSTAQMEKHLFNLKFAAKQLNRDSKKCEKEEKAERAKLKKAMEKGNMEVARIHAENGTIFGIKNYLTAVFFETGAMLTPTKSRNGTNCGSGGSFQSYLTHS